MSKNKILLIIIAVIVLVGSYFMVDYFSKNKDHIGDIEIVHELGITKVKSNPEKVVVFDFGILETLDELEIEVIGVPKSNLPKHLDKYNNSSVTDVGTLFEPNFEVIYNLKPDLIIISGRQSGLYEELNALAPTIYLPIDNVKFVESVKTNLTVLSQIFTKENKFSDYILEIEQEINDLNQIASNSSLNALILMVNTSNISALGIGSRYDVVHSAFGVIPADPNITISTHGQNVQYEYIANVNPDIIFVIDRGIITEGEGTAKTLLNNSIVNQTKAAINDRIIYLTPESWYISTGGVTSVKVMIEEVKLAFTK